MVEVTDAGGSDAYVGSSDGGARSLSRIRWTVESETSLESDYRAIAGTRPATARRTLENLLHRLDSLAASPENGRVYPYAEDVRITSYGQFRVAYRQQNAGLLVLGVFHGRIFLPPL